MDSSLFVAETGVAFCMQAGEAIAVVFLGIPEPEFPVAITTEIFCATALFIDVASVENVESQYVE